MQKSDEVEGIEIYGKHGLHLDFGFKIEIIGAFEASLVSILNVDVNVSAKSDTNVSPLSLLEKEKQEKLLKKFEFLKKLPSKLETFLGEIAGYRKGIEIKNIKENVELKENNLEKIEQKIKEIEKEYKIIEDEESLKGEVLNLVQEEAEIIFQSEQEIAEYISQTTIMQDIVESYVSKIEYDVSKVNLELSFIKKNIEDIRDYYSNLEVELEKIEKSSETVYGNIEKMGEAIMAKVDKRINNRKSIKELISGITMMSVEKLEFEKDEE